MNSLPAINPTLPLFSAKYLVKAQTGDRLINDLKIVLPILVLLLVAVHARAAFATALRSGRRRDDERHHPLRVTSRPAARGRVVSGSRLH